MPRAMFIMKVDMEPNSFCALEQLWVVVSQGCLVISEDAQNLS